MVPQGGSFPPPPPPSLPGIHLEASFRGACSGNVTRTSGRPFPGHDDPHRGAGEPFRGFPFGKVRSPVRGFLRIGEGARRCDFRSPQARGFCHKAEQGGHAFSGAGERGACERKRAGMPFSRPQGMRQLSLIVRDRARLMRRALHVHGRDGARAQHTQAPIVSFSKRRTKKGPGASASRTFDFSSCRMFRHRAYSASSKGSPPSRFISSAIFHSRVTTSAPTAKMPRPMEISQKVGV